MLELEIIHVIAESKNSWEDAINEAIASAVKNDKEVKSINIKQLQVEVKDNKISSYRIYARLAYIPTKNLSLISRDQEAS